MGVSSAPRKREREQPGRPFSIEKKGLRQQDSEATGTNKEDDAGGLSPITNQKLQHSEEHAKQVIKVAPWFASQSIPHPDNVKKAEGVVDTKTFRQNSDKQPLAPVANIKNWPTATVHMPLTPLALNKLQHSEEHAKQVIKVAPCIVSQSIPHPDNVKKAKGAVYTKTFCQNSDKQPLAPVANTKICPTATGHQPLTPFALNKPKKADDFETLEPNRLPVYLLAGSRIVNQILGRDVNNQFTRVAFESEGLDPHPLARGFRETGCPPIASSSVPTDKDAYLLERTFALGGLLEEMDVVHQQILRKKEANLRANVNFLWLFLDAKVEICRKIKRQIAAAGASSQEIPAYMIR